MEHIFDMLHADSTLMIGSNNYQELCCELYRRGVYTVDIYKKPHESNQSRGRLVGWNNVPPVVCLILVVPRDRLKVLDINDSGSPMILCDLRSPTFHNFFSSIQLVFGKVTVQGSGNDARAVVIEDTSGWAGSSPLIVSFWVPSMNLTIDPQRTEVGLRLHPTPDSARAFTEKLGMMLSLYSVKLMNRHSVHVLAQCPYFSKDSASRQPRLSPIPSLTQRVSVALDYLKVSTLAVKWDITGARPSDAQGEVRSEQVSPCVMRVTLGQVSKDLIFPFPVNGTDSKIRIARKSGWIEVCVLSHLT
jgi:hypothetical protein